MNIPTISTSWNIQPQALAWLPSFEIPFNPLSGRCDLNWRDSVMIAGVVLSIACAASAIFLSAYATGTAFIIVGAILLYSTYYVHNFDDGIALQDNIQILKQQSQELQTAQKKAESTAAQLGRQYAEVQTINQQLNQTIASLQTNVRNLQTANADLTRNNQTLQSTAQQLQQNNLTLQQRITALQQTIPLLTQQVANFTNENINLGNNLNALHTNASTLDQQNRALSASINGIDLTFDQNVLALNQEIQHAQAVAKTLFASLGDQKKALELQVIKIETSAGNLKALELTLKLQTATLANLEKQVAARAGDLQKLNQDLQTTKIAFDQEKQAYDQKVLQLTQEQLAFAIEEQKLEKTKKDLEALPAKFIEAELKLKEEIELIEKKKNTQLTQLDSKINARIEEAKKKKQELAILDAQIEERRTELALLAK